MLFGLISVPLTTNYIAPSQYGVATFFTTIFDLLMIILNLGSTSGVLRFFHAESPDARRRLFLRAILAPSMMLVLMFVVGSFCWRKFSLYIFNEVTAGGMLLMALAVVFGLIERYTSLLLRLKERAAFFSSISIFNKILYVGFVVVFISMRNYSYFAMIIPAALSYVITAAAGFFAEWRFWTTPSKKTKQLQESTVPAKMFFAYSLPFIFAQYLDYGFSHIDRIIIKTFMSPEALGIYGAATRIIVFLYMLKYALNLCWSPEIFKQNAEGAKTGKIIKEMFEIFSFINASAIIAVIAGLNVFMLLFGHRYAAVRDIAPLLAVVPSMMLLTTISETGINLAKKPLYHLLVGGLICILQAVLACVLIKIWGLRGVAVANAAAAIAMMYGKGIASYWLTGAGCGLLRSAPVFIAVLIPVLANTFWRPQLWLNLLVALTAEVIVIIIYHSTALRLCHSGINIFQRVITKKIRTHLNVIL